MTDVVALGGHALTKPGGGRTPASDPARIDAVARTLAASLGDAALVVTHGNGPQAGWLAAQADLALGPRDGLDVITAQTEGLTGYQLELALQNALPHRLITTLLTRVEVNAGDPELHRPSKPIGPAYDDEEADCLRARGFTVGRDRRGFRRLVPSPFPLRVFEEPAIRRLLEGDAVVICGGGGGIPVCRGPAGTFVGVDGIVDKDHTSALLASTLDARRLFLLTDVAGVHPDWPATDQVVRRAGTARLSERDWAEGSMAPKVAAAVRFVEATSATAWIGRVDDLAGMLAGTAGTAVCRGSAWTVEPVA